VTQNVRIRMLSAVSRHCANKPLVHLGRNDGQALSSSIQIPWDHVFEQNPDSDNFVMVPDCLLGVPDCLLGAPDCYCAFSAMDWQFPFTYWCLMLDACLMVHGSRLMAHGSWLMAHGQGVPVRPWCPRERRGRTWADLALPRAPGPDSPPLAMGHEPWAKRLEPWAMNHQACIKHQALRNWVPRLW